MTTNNKLSFKQLLLVGSTIFGLFFGAGNLIFPVSLGQQATHHFWATSIGFLTSAILLPLLGIIAVAFTQANGIYDLAKPVGPRFAKFMVIALFTLIGPLYALPRLATVPYSMAIQPYVNASHNTLFLALFSGIFFTLTFLFALNRNKLMDYIGKYLNPIFLVLLIALLLFVFFQPFGNLSTHWHQLLTKRAYTDGFLVGYNTMDTLGSLEYGILAVSIITSFGITEPRAKAMATLKGGSVGMLGMGLIYLGLLFAGATSTTTFGHNANGGLILANIATHYFGSVGNILFAGIIYLACITTAIGVTSAFATTLHEAAPKVGFQRFALVAILISFIVSNVGLTTLIKVSVPLLYFIYPLAIVLIVLSLTRPLFYGAKPVYQWAIYLTFLASFVDALGSLTQIINVPWLNHFASWAKTYIPLYSYQLDFLFPAVIGAGIGLSIYYRHRTFYQANYVVALGQK